MPIRPLRFLYAACAALVITLLAACGSTPTPAPAPGSPPATPTRPAPPAPTRDPHLAAFSAKLDARGVEPVTASAGQASVVAVLNRSSGLLRWRLEYGGLSGPVRSGAFLGPGPGGKEVAVLPLGRRLSSPYEGRAILTPRQRADLLEGRWSALLRTAAHPQGEIGGRLLEQR